MLNSSTSVWLGITFVLIDAINVWLILQVSARVKDARASTRLVAAHRIGGYLFIALFCVMGYFMLARLGDVDGGASPGAMIHLTLAMVLSPLLFVKVLIARYYKNYYSFLMPIGLVIFVLSFVLIGITAGPALVHPARTQTVSLEAIDLPPAAIDINMAAATMDKRCSKCHGLERIVGASKDARGWLATVNRMKALPDSGISDEDSRIIVSYLASQMAPKGPLAAATLRVGRALVDQRCGRCHSLDRVYKTLKTPEEWRATVAEMAGFAEGSANAFQPGEDQQIVSYLSAARTLDAVDQGRSQEMAASSGRSTVNQRDSAATEKPVQRGRYDIKRIVFFTLLCLGTLTLIVRRPVRVPVGAPLRPAEARSGAVQAACSVPSGPSILRLASITAQTADSKTLRFILPNDRKLNARPGQFLTFSFLFDGKKVTRSYSICSSPAQSGYVEITAKRVSQGCASVFLNDRASVGMTVEASGAFGQFCFDETRHQNVVLLAAGSGITPMMAMLRYTDDLCLETNVTLLYCVRTRSDIIFHDELEALQARLKNFQYHVLLSQPHAEWFGGRGHINREFIEETIKEPASVDFFICGPPPFMETSRNILMGMGVKVERILQENFGSSGPKNVQPGREVPEPGVMVEFFRSGKTCLVRSGQTVLETAEEHGVGIPSSCRQGQCGTCKTRLLEGKVRMDTEEGLDPDSRAQGFVLTCVGHAEGAVKLDA
jgi:ferredoxin-NADP reductase/mono/diheme cytochrome c family protein